MESHKGVGILDHPLLTPTMLCIEGTAAAVRGELGDPGKITYILYLISILPQFDMNL